MRRVLIIMLLVLSSGCSRTPNQLSEAPAATLPVGQSYLAYRLPAGFKPSRENGQLSWSKKDVGLLRVRNLGLQPGEAAARALDAALESGDLSPLVSFPPQAFEPRGSMDEPIERVRQLSRGAGRQGEAAPLPPAIRQELQKLSALFRSSENSTLEARAPAAIGTQPPLEPRTIEVEGQPVRMISYRTSYGEAASMYLLDRGEMIQFEFFGAAPEGYALFETLAQSLELDRKTPIPVDVPTPERPGNKKSSSPKPGWLSWLTPLLAYLPTVIVLLFTSLPAYLGASLGYQNAELTDGDVRRGASSGAFQGALTGVFVGFLLSAAFVVVVAASSESRGGMMSGGVGAFVLILMLTIGSTVAGLGAGTLAALGARLGASAGRGPSALLAALLAGPGLLLGFWLWGQSH